jgi:hypothetical protein
MRQATRRAVLPRCRHCQRTWRPADGVVASDSFCSVCSESRREIAAKHLELARLSPDGNVPYLLPRALRPKGQR